MKMYKTQAVPFIFSLIVLVIAGCQSGSSQEKIGPSVETQSIQKKPADTPSTGISKAAEPAEGAVAQKIALTKDKHDFGKVGPGTSHQADYEFVNNGQSALLISGIQSTCGCSMPALIKDGQRFAIPLKEPVSFEPGQGGKVEVTFKAGVSKGAITKHLYVLSDDPVTPRAQLELKADIVVKVEVQPESVQLEFDKENAGIPDIVVKSIDGVPFSIKSATVANHVIDIPFDPTAQATEFKLKPTVDIQKLNQFNSGVIQITTTHPQAGTLLVRYNAKQMYEMSNPRFILQNVEPGQPLIRENLIRSNYDKKAEIESVESKNGYMEIESQEQDGNHIKLKIKITPPAQDSKSRRYITDELKITLKDGYILTVRCSGWFRLT